VVAGLPAALRREIGVSRSRIERLDAAVHALKERQRELDAAIAQANGGTPAGDPEQRARHHALLKDLVQARDDAVARGRKLNGALENVRLQLLRVRSGVGTTADVAAEVRSAEALVI